MKFCESCNGWIKGKRTYCTKCSNKRKREQKRLWSINRKKLLKIQGHTRVINEKKRKKHESIRDEITAIMAAMCYRKKNRELNLKKSFI